MLLFTFLHRDHDQPRTESGASSGLSYSSWPGCMRFSLNSVIGFHGFGWCVSSYLKMMTRHIVPSCNTVFLQQWYFLLEWPEDWNSRCRESYATSLSSGVLEYNWEHGRRFHGYKEGSAFCPYNDLNRGWLSPRLQVPQRRARAGSSWHFSPCIQSGTRWPVVSRSYFGRTTAGAWHRNGHGDLGDWIRYVSSFHWNRTQADCTNTQRTSFLLQNW